MILVFLVALPIGIIGGILLIVTNNPDFILLMAVWLVLGIMLPILHDSETFKHRKCIVHSG